MVKWAVKSDLETLSLSDIDGQNHHLSVVHVFKVQSSNRKHNGLSEEVLPCFTHLKNSSESSLVLPPFCDHTGDVFTVSIVLTFMQSLFLMCGCCSLCDNVTPQTLLGNLSELWQNKQSHMTSKASSCQRGSFEPISSSALSTKNKIIPRQKWLAEMIG